MRGEKDNQEASAVITPSTATETSERAPSPTKFAPAIETRAKKKIPWRMRRVFSLQDLDRPATRFLPAPVFGYVSGVAETGLTHKANRRQFHDYRFVPRTLRGHLVRDQGTTLFGTRYERPFGVAPMGFSALAAYDGDVVLAKAAAEWHAGHHECHLVDTVGARCRGGKQPLVPSLFSR